MIYVIDFDPIGIETHLASQTDHQYLNFVKDAYVVGKKMARNYCKMAKRKNCPFHFESESNCTRTTITKYGTFHSMSIGVIQIKRFRDFLFFLLRYVGAVCVLASNIQQLT